jgi:DNA-binding CsgD family transcriptional regulator
MKNRESFIYGRLEMLAIEACVHYKMKNKTEAWHVLREAYEEAAPNEITMPFIELGKDMRTLAIAALRSLPDDSHPGIGIPRPWLEFIKHKATSYAKNHSKFVVKNKMDNNGNVDLSPREMDVLTDLYHGFTQAEIASKKSLSINTVKMVTKSIYEKLDVHKISDLVRIAAERGLV